MPYIAAEDRPQYDKVLEELTTLLKKNPPESIDGHLNYVITKIIKEVYPLRYYHINKAMGVLECVQHEFYRRVAAPYEDTKIEQNGDV
jgi:ribosomal protein S3AE